MYNLIAFFTPSTDFPTFIRDNIPSPASNIFCGESSCLANATAVSYPIPSKHVRIFARSFTSFGRKIGARGRYLFLAILLSSCAELNPLIALC